MQELEFHCCSCRFSPTSDVVDATTYSHMSGTHREQTLKCKDESIFDEISRLKTG